MEDAIAMNERMGYVPATTRSQVALGEILGESRRPQDVARAAALLVSAGATARRLDMTPLLAQIERSKSRLDGAGVARSTARARG
jgi:hypothetical protein